MEQRDYRLAAIMFTDIVGFSRMMEQDEAGTLTLLAEHNRVIEGLGIDERCQRALAIDKNSDLVRDYLSQRLFCRMSIPLVSSKLMRPECREGKHNPHSHTLLVPITYRNQAAYILFGTGESGRELAPELAERFRSVSAQVLS